MSKTLSTLKKTEVWLTIGSIVLGFVSTIVVLTSYVNELKSGQELISQKLDEYITRTGNLTLAINKLEPHVCNLDTINHIVCINGGN